MQESVILGVKVEHPCGLVAAELETAEAYQAFAIPHCIGLDDAACKGKYGGMFLARLRERYPRVNMEWVTNHCTGYPDDSSSFEGMELQYLRTHNEAVRAALDAETSAINREVGAEREARLLAQAAEQARQAEERERQRQQKSARRRAKWRAVGQALGGYGEAQQRAADQMSPGFDCKTYDDGVTSCNRR